MINYKTMQEIAQAACRLVACDYGFEKNLVLSQIPRQIQLLDVYLDEGKDDPFSPSTYIELWQYFKSLLI